MYNLVEIFEQATKDAMAFPTTLPEGKSIIGRGAKIQKFGDKIEILNMGKGGDYFKECNPDEYQIFLDNGWKAGTIKLSISNCKHKLELIEDKIKTELNTRKNDKHIQNLKSRREALLQKYANLKIKLNKL
tara:strand:+ start:46 stop:438 length:393 start_codon:yes stop_codon:yes gene_type:complete